MTFDFLKMAFLFLRQILGVTTSQRTNTQDP